MHHENGIIFSDTTPMQNAPGKKISQKIQSLLKTDDLTQIISCFVLLKEQPSHLTTSSAPHQAGWFMGSSHLIARLRVQQGAIHTDSATVPGQLTQSWFHQCPIHPGSQHGA